MVFISEIAVASFLSVCRCDENNIIPVERIEDFKGRPVSIRRSIYLAGEDRVSKDQPQARTPTMVDMVGLSRRRSLSLGNPFYGVSFDPWLPVNLTNYVPEGEARNSAGSRCVNSVVAFRLTRARARLHSPTRILLP